MNKHQQETDTILAASVEVGQDALALYEERKQCYAARVGQCKRWMNRWSNLRLLIFLLAVVGVVWTVKANVPMGALLFLVGGIGLFVAAVIRHHFHTRNFERASGLLRINVEGIQRCRGEWQMREGMTGEGFLDKGHAYASDLDLFGARSLFHWFNTARTSAGQRTLAAWLKQAPREGQLEQRQEAIRELAGKLDWRQKLEAEGLAVEDGDVQLLYGWAESLRDGGRGTWEWLKYAPVLTLVVGGVAWGSGHHLLTMLALVMVVVQALIAQGLSRRWHGRIVAAMRWENELAICRRLLELVDEEVFQTALNRVSAEKLRFSSRWLRRLETRLSFLAMRNNPIVHFIFNTACWWDWQWMLAVDGWRREHGVKLRGWMEEFAELEARCSLSVIAFEQPEWVFPQVDETGVKPLHVEQMGHPLLPMGSRVCNDFRIAAPGAVTIITGSNMSGKSTFLRTVGVNLVLAQVGAPVCAKRWVFTPMALFTSMRIADDMNSGVSSFYAELLRIKMIVDAAKSGAVLYLIDEIFRGTNSGDRVAGAMEVLKALSRTQAVGLVSTHDLELSRLEQTEAGRFSNFHFSERFTEDGMEFDYTIQSGPATTTNARHLIRMVGIGGGD